MCLAYLDEKLPDTKYGYKVFKVTKNGIVSEYCGNGSEYPIEKWIDEKDYREDKSSETLPTWDKVKKEEEYKIGFHCFFYKKDAKKWCYYRGKTKSNLIIRKVEVKEIVAKGWQDSVQNISDHDYVPIFVCNIIKIKKSNLSLKSSIFVKKSKY